MLTNNSQLNILTEITIENSGGGGGEKKKSQKSALPKTLGYHLLVAKLSLLQDQGDKCVATCRLGCD